MMTMPSFDLDEGSLPVMSAHHQRAFTLIESIVVVGIIAALIAILLPAVQMARESARRAQCANNLKQIGITSHSYEGAAGCLPPGRMMTYDPRYSGSSPPCTSPIVDKSLFVHILRYLEQTSLYNSINSDLTIFGYENQTARSITISTFACPSDAGAGQVVRAGNALILYSLGLAAPGEPYPVFFGSYAGMYDSYYLNAIPRPSTNCRVPPEVLAQVNGSFNDTSPIRLASVNDGLSHTLFVAERALFPLIGISDRQGSAYGRYGWAISGNWGDTLVTAFFPPNMYRKVATEGNLFQYFAASSMHPGGLNVLMGDGSIRFVKDSISTWPFDPDSGMPLGAIQSGSGAWSHALPAGFWQALTTRNGGEMINSDDF
jgi:prepilin-type N-terminal cleavage/methylation domain-containing protein/prepilin-type processing-associated H-X9-DG protein